MELEKGELLPITITAQMRHGILWKAKARLGSTKALAEYLGITQNQAGNWINFKSYPTREWWDTKGIEIEGKLRVLLERGVSYEELFPAAIRTKAFALVKKRQEVTLEIPVERLIEAGAAPRELLGEVEILRAESLAKDMEQSLGTLTPREEKVIRMRFGLSPYEGERTYEEVSEEFGITRERIRQIEAKALRKLRHPTRTKKLKPHLMGRYYAPPRIVKEIHHPQIEEKVIAEEVENGEVEVLVDGEVNKVEVRQSGAFGGNLGDYFPLISADELPTGAEVREGWILEPYPRQEKLVFLNVEGREMLLGVYINA